MSARNLGHGRSEFIREGASAFNTILIVRTAVFTNISGPTGFCARRNQPNRCLDISLEISTIEVFPVNSNFTLPSAEK